MAKGDFYRAQAGEVFGQLKEETSSLLRVELLRLAQAYLRLAEQADRRLDDPAPQSANDPQTGAQRHGEEPSSGQMH